MHGRNINPLSGLREETIGSIAEAYFRQPQCRHPKVETITRKWLFYYLSVNRLCVKAVVIVEDREIYIK